MSEFIQKSVMPVSAEELLVWHGRPGAFERLLTPWENIEIIRVAPSLTDGARAELAVRIGPFSKRWIAEHHALSEGIGFHDSQVRGPFAKWEHTHRMTPVDAETSWLDDRIQYNVPLGWFGHLLVGALIKRSLNRTFAYRHRVTHADLTAHRDARKRQTQRNETMKILVTGSTGLVGSTVVAFLTTGGHRVLRLVRGSARNIAYPAHTDGYRRVASKQPRAIFFCRRGWPPGGSRAGDARAARACGRKRLDAVKRV